MTYEKQTWVDGVSPLNAERFNHMEDGIAKNAEEIGKVGAEVENLTGVTKLIQVPITEKDIVYGAMIYGKDGKELVTETWNCTDFLPVQFDAGSEATIKCTVFGNGGFAFYDRNKAFLLGVYKANCAEYGITEDGLIQTMKIVIPEGAAYVRLSYQTGWKETYNDLAVEGHQTTNLQSQVAELEIKHEQTSEHLNQTTEYLNRNITDFSAKKVLVIGDSISADYYGEYPKWVTHLSDENFFSAELVTNSSTHATGFVARYNNQANDFITRVEAVSDKERYDLVIIFGGINDFIQSIPLGGEGETDRAVYFKPAVDYFFEYLVNNFTQARIVVLSPLRTYNVYPNQVSAKQDVYTSYIREVAKSYCLPILNLSEESGFIPFNETFKNMWTYTGWSGGDGTEGDGVHPSEEYERRFLAPMIRGFLQRIM